MIERLKVIIPRWLLLVSVINVVLCQEDLGRVFLEGGLHLKQSLGLFHSSRQLVLHNDGRNALAGEQGFGGVRSHLIGSAAQVLAAVFRIGVQDVERYETEFVHCAEAVTGLQRTSMVEPLDAQVGVTFGFNAALKVALFTFLDVDLGDLSDEASRFHRRFLWSQFDDWSAFQVTKFLAGHALRQLRVHVDSALGCKSSEKIQS